jgi:hypothetical protein
MSGESARRTVARVRSQILVPRSKGESGRASRLLWTTASNHAMHGQPREREPPDTGRVMGRITAYGNEVRLAFV